MLLLKKGHEVRYIGPVWRRLCQLLYNYGRARTRHAASRVLGQLTRSQPPSMRASSNALPKHLRLTGRRTRLAYSHAGRCGGLSREDGRREETVEKRCGLAPDADVRVWGAAN